MFSLVYTLRDIVWRVSKAVHTPIQTIVELRDICMEGQQACLHSIQSFVKFYKAL